MLQKMVNGIVVDCTPEEESHILFHQQLNQQYPEYFDCFPYDGASLPVINLERAKEVHKQLLQPIISDKISSINKQIETAEENGDEATRAALIKKRAHIKTIPSVDMSNFNSLDDFKKHLEDTKSL